VAGAKRQAFAAPGAALSPAMRPFIIAKGAAAIKRFFATVRYKAQHCAKNRNLGRILPLWIVGIRMTLVGLLKCRLGMIRARGASPHRQGAARRTGPGLWQSPLVPWRRVRC
jgi:hypothetical protein